MFRSLHKPPSLRIPEEACKIVNICSPGKAEPPQKPISIIKQRIDINIIIKNIIHKTGGISSVSSGHSIHSLSGDCFDGRRLHG